MIRSPITSTSTRTYEQTIEYVGKVKGEDISDHLVKEFVEKGVIPKWWVPDKVTIVSEIPKTSTEKIDKKTLREKLATG